jgi:hypothetical protein
MTEAERIAQELVEEIDGFPQATKLEQEACNMIRSQAAEIERLTKSLARKEDEDFWTGVCESLDMEIACWRVSYNNGKTWTIWETDPQPSMFDTKQGMIVHPLYVPKHCATMKENKHD